MEIKSKQKLLELMRTNRNKKKGVKLEIFIPGYPALEIIHVFYINIPKKIEYINKTYDNKLNHKHSDGVMIVGVEL